MPSKAKWLAEQNAKQAGRKAMFDRVCNSENWKLPIRAELPHDTDLNEVVDAIVHFTGSRPSFTHTATGWRVEAAGYYATIGA